MDRLDENMKRTMQVASVIGRDFAFRILQTITGMKEELKSYLINLQGLEFIYEKSLFPELEYIFKHALIQEVAYNSLLIKRRKEIHERIGKAIEDIYTERLEEFYEMLAYHYSRSDNQEKAFNYLRLSSMKVGARNAIVESVRFGKEAVAVLNQMPQTDENKKKGIEMRLMLSGPMVGTGQLGEAQQMMEEGARLAEEVGDDRSLANLYGTLGLSMVFQGDSVHGAEYAEKAFQAAERTGDVVLMTTNLYELCVACSGTGAFSRIVQASPRVLDLLEKEHLERRSDLGKYYNLNLYSVIKSAYGVSLGYLGDMETGLAVCEEACRFAEEVGNLYAIAAVEGWCNTLLITRGDGTGAIGHGAKCLESCERGQLATLLWAVPTSLGWIHYLSGELDAARGQFEKRLETYRSTQSTLYVSAACNGLALVCLDLGDVEAARTHIEESLELTRKHGERHEEGRSVVILGRVVGKADPSQSAKAEGLILEGIKMLEELKVKPYQAEGYLYLGELYADTGQKEKALETLNKAEGMFRQMGMDYWVARTEKVLEKLKG
jgi:tetratricopeptide (TPR) repeat protein